MQGSRPHVLGRQVVPDGQGRLEEQAGTVGLGERLTVELHTNGPRAPHDVDAVERVPRVAVVAFVLLVPGVEAVEVEHDEAGQGGVSEPRAHVARLLWIRTVAAVPTLSPARTDVQAPPWTQDRHWPRTVVRRTAVGLRLVTLDTIATLLRLFAGGAVPGVWQPIPLSAERGGTRVSGQSATARTARHPTLPSGCRDGRRPMETLLRTPRLGGASRVPRP